MTLPLLAQAAADAAPDVATTVGGTALVISLFNALRAEWAQFRIGQEKARQADDQQKADDSRARSLAEAISKAIVESANIQQAALVKALESPLLARLEQLIDAQKEERRELRSGLERIGQQVSELGERMASLEAKGER